MGGSTPSTSGERIEQQHDFGLANWRTVLLVAVLMAASLVPIWATTHFPSQNGPWYLLQVHMTKEFNNPAWDYSDYYRISWHPTPHMLHNVLVFALNYIFPLLIAEKVALSVYVILMPLSIFYFLSSVAPDRKILGLLAFLMIHSYVFYRGYHNFSLSIPLFFFTFAFWHRHREHLGLKQAVMVAAMAGATYLAHLATFLFLACTIGCYRLVETRRLRRAILAVLCVTWPGWLLFVDHCLLVSGNANWIDPSDTSLLRPHTAIENVVRKMFYSISFPAYILAALPWLWVVYLLCRRFLCLKRGRNGFWQSFFRDPLLVVLGAGTLCYFVVPYKVLGWHYVNIRMIPFIFVLAMACAASLPELRRRSIFRAAFVTTVCVAALGVDCLLSLKVVQMHRDVEEYTSGIPAFDGNTPLLPILAENKPFGQVRPVTRCHEYYHVEKGGANGYGIAETANTLVCMWYRTYPATTPFPRFRPECPAESMKRIKETYGYVLLWGEDEEWISRLGSYGFDLVHHNGRLRLFKNELL